jgi:hypothetical protein
LSGHAWTSLLFALFACGRVGFDNLAGDALLEDALDHVTVADGWSVRVFHDFSEHHDYDPAEFPDGSEIHDNAPNAMFVLYPPYAEGLAVIAGRQVLEITANTYVAHDYGLHAANTPGLPDKLSGGTFVPDLDGTGPAVLVCSSSENAGDGLFRISTSWLMSFDLDFNNVRDVFLDGAGTFDDLGGTQIYFTTPGGVYRRPETTAPIVNGQLRSGHVGGGDLWLARDSTTQAELVRVTSTTHALSIITTRSRVKLGAGFAPLPYIGWVLLDAAQLTMLGATGAIDLVAESTDSEFIWKAAVAPPSTHALGSTPPIVYVLETNRVRDLDRILVFSRP